MEEQNQHCFNPLFVFNYFKKAKNLVRTHRTESFKETVKCQYCLGTMKDKSKPTLQFFFYYWQNYLHYIMQY